MHTKILIIADIEGSSGCRDYESSAFKTKKWAGACVEMSKDVNALVKALLDAGAEQIFVKDFHRTGFNLFPELIDPRARIIPGYINGMVPGIGDPPEVTGLMMTGMHASSGSGGFLAHTLTSRIERLTVNGTPMAEVELFSSALAPFNIRPIFFSGCPVACAEAQRAIKNITVHAIDKAGNNRFNSDAWRTQLAARGVESLMNDKTIPCLLTGPFSAKVVMRDGPMYAKKLAERWGFKYKGNTVFLEEKEIRDLYHNLIRLCYLTPFVEKILPLGLPLYNLYGLWGRKWAMKHSDYRRHTWMRSHF
ncbi:MAG: hypothetical protein EPN93_18630 [Spirochaetes bacterium]|nr:MAG: hypothetical protein EPN93_18630 [Spirochaetota bacterium]